MVRFHVEQPYTKDWNRLRANPGKLVRQWCSQAGCKLRDTWAWELATGPAGKQTRIQGLARIEVKFLNDLLKASGSMFENIRVFTECAHRQPNIATYKPTGVGWQAYHPTEAWLEYAARVRQLSTQFGVVRGPKYLGVRRVLTEEEIAAPSKHIRHWKALGVPRNWTEDQLHSVISYASFVDIQVLERRLVVSRSVRRRH